MLTFFGKESIRSRRYFPVFAPEKSRSGNLAMSMELPRLKRTGIQVEKWYKRILLNVIPERTISAVGMTDDMGNLREDELCCCKGHSGGGSRDAEDRFSSYNSCNCPGKHG